MYVAYILPFIQELKVAYVAFLPPMFSHNDPNWQVELRENH